MQLSQKGLDFIKSFEGLRLKAYKAVDTEKHWTIGYGHCGPDVHEGETISKKQAESILKKDVDKFVDGVNNLLKVSVNQNQFDALVSFAYNVGLGALKASTLLKFVNHRDFPHAAQEFDLWIHSGGRVLTGLIKRRKAEKEMFLSKVESPKLSNHYTIKKGDTLSELAAKFGVSVRDLSLLNPQIKDVDKISVGQVINVPDHEKPKITNISYTVKKGDTMSEIAKRYKTTVQAIVKTSGNVKDPDKIYIGQKLKIPKQ